MNNVAHQPQPRVARVIYGRELQLLIPQQCSEIDIRYVDSRDLALKVDSREASRLVARGWVSGFVNKKNILRYLILMVPKRIIVRLLRTEAPRNPHDVTSNRPGALSWPVRLERSKCGVARANRRVWLRQRNEVENES